MGIPDPVRHFIRYCGAYPTVVRCRRWRDAALAVAVGCAEEMEKARTTDVAADPDSRALCRELAQIIGRICEGDPPSCPRCGRTMHIITFIAETGAIHKILTHLAAKGPMGPALPARLNIAFSEPGTTAPVTVRMPVPRRSPARQTSQPGFCASRGPFPASLGASPPPIHSASALEWH